MTNITYALYKSCYADDFRIRVIKIRFQTEISGFCSTGNRPTHTTGSIFPLNVCYVFGKRQGVTVFFRNSFAITPSILRYSAGSTPMPKTRVRMSMSSYCVERDRRVFRLGQKPPTCPSISATVLYPVC